MMVFIIVMPENKILRFTGLRYLFAVRAKLQAEDDCKVPISVNTNGDGYQR